MSVRLDREHRMRQILEVGTQLALDNGLYSEDVTRATVALGCRVSRPLVSYYYNSDKELRRAILKNAIINDTQEKGSKFVIIAQAAAISDPLLDTAPKKLIGDALKWINNSH